MNKFSAKRARLQRTRAKMRRLDTDRPRLSVHRSSAHIYVQLIDDTSRKTLAAASTLDKELKGTLKTGADTEAAKAVGKLVAERAVKLGITDVRFDRGSLLYHGRVAALADAAREAGLKF